jgi:hypothetical protein
MNSESSTEKVKCVGVLAAWCDSSNHLVTPPLEEYLAEPQHQQLCNLIAQRWDPCGSAGQEIQLEATCRHHGKVPATAAYLSLALA